MVASENDQLKIYSARRSRGCCVELLDYFLHAADDKREAVVIEFVRSVGGSVVMWVAKRCGVRNHDAAIAVSPEGPLIRPRDARNEGRERGAFGRKPRMFTEETDGAAEEWTRMNVATKPMKLPVVG